MNPRNYELRVTGYELLTMNPTNPMDIRQPRTKHQELGTVLVTGGAGFIGSHLCDRLLKEGRNVLCLDNFNDFYDPMRKERNIAQAKQYPNFNLIRGDILDVGLLERIFSGSCQEPIANSQQLEAIIHLAAMAGVRPSLASPMQYVDIDIKGTVNLLEKAKEYGIKQFIFGSSSSVYGARNDGPFSEEDATDVQVSPYATAKKAGELYCRTYANLYSIPTTVLRFFTVYGPRQRPEMAIHRFAKLMLIGEMVSMFGDGTSARDYTFIEDIVDGIIAAVERPFPFEIINLGSGRTVQLTEMVNTLSGVLGIEPRIDRLPEQLGDVPLTHADVSKAKELLGYEARTGFQEGIQRFVEWMKQEEAP